MLTQTKEAYFDTTGTTIPLEYGIELMHLIRETTRGSFNCNGRSRFLKSNITTDVPIATIKSNPQ